MSILNLGKVVRTFNNMQTAIQAESGAKVNNGWQAPRTQTLSARTVPSNPTPPAILTEGDGVLKTVKIAQEIIHEGLAGHALTGATNLWFDGEVHRTFSANLSLVHDILTGAVKQITGNAAFNLDDYLLHVNDSDSNVTMHRPQGQNFSYFASQMAIIDPSGGAHFLSMDRVRTNNASAIGYDWRALALDPKYELSIQHKEAGGLSSVEAATSYVKVGDIKIAIFSRQFSSLAKLLSSAGRSSNSRVEYAYREVPAVQSVVRYGMNTMLDRRSHAA